VTSLSPVMYRLIAVNVQNKYSIEEPKKYIKTYMNRIDAVMFLQILTSYRTCVCVGDTISFKSAVTILSKARQQ
jgi:hypothetical protein